MIVQNPVTTTVAMSVQTLPGRRARRAATYSGSSFRHPGLVYGGCPSARLRATRSEQDMILESKGRADEGVKLLAEIIINGQRRVYRDFD